MQPKVTILIDKPSYSAQREGRLLTGFEQALLNEKAARAGLLPAEVVVMLLEGACPETPMCIPMGERALEMTTGKKSIWKWHLSPLNTLPCYETTMRAVPTFEFGQMLKDWQLTLYFELAMRKAAKHVEAGPWVRKEEYYVLGPSPDEAIARLESLATRPPEWLSIDIETGRNQINTFGVAWSANEAIAIKVLPDGIPAVAFKKLWDSIARLCESDVPKVMQNGIYERTYLSRYGILVNNFAHDTMCAQKFLWPELDKGLDNVGRIYTMEPYWKDDAIGEAEAGSKKDWGNVRDWDKHFAYNCRDTTNTLIAMHAQRADLQSRNLLKLYDTYIRRLFDPVYEMGSRGLPLNTDKQVELIAEFEARSRTLVAGLSKQINPRSPKAKLGLLRDKGYKLPIKRSTGKESADELSLKQLRLKHPGDDDLRILLAVAGVEKALSSYLRVKTFDDRRIRFMLDAHGTETGRFSCYKDPWGGGFNAQTLTAEAKQMIEWPIHYGQRDAGRVFVEIDLKSAETYFVAYDACEETLLHMLHTGQDIHKYVAAEIYGIPMADVTHDQRQLGKKSGHGANYSMGVSTFQDSCLKEMDLVLDKKMATRVLESYHKLFPGIRRWQSNLRSVVYRERKLTNPLGRERYFYGRIDDSAYREAYAYRPQSTIPDIANHLMLGLLEERRKGNVDFWLHMQCHDSVLISCAPGVVPQIAEFAFETKRWHPEIILPAGRLVIPTEVKYGICLGNKIEYK